MLQKVVDEHLWDIPEASAQIELINDDAECFDPANSQCHW
jgi:hypothetical protein